MSLSEIFSNNQKYLKKINCTVISMYMLIAPIKHSGLYFLKKSLFNNHCYIFLNFRSLVRPGLIIETLRNEVSETIYFNKCSLDVVIVSITPKHPTENFISMNFLQMFCMITVVQKKIRLQLQKKMRPLF